MKKNNKEQEEKKTKRNVKEKAKARIAIGPITCNQYTRSDNKIGKANGQVLSFPQLYHKNSAIAERTFSYCFLLSTKNRKETIHR